MTKFSLALIVFSQVVATGAVAQSAAEKGRQIVLKSTDSSGGYKTSSASGEMALHSANGKVSKRRFYTKSIEGSGSEGTKSLLVFEWPGDIRNTGLLTHARKNASDRQWLFLPSIRRVKKISSSGRSGSFVGSEFSYQDMVDQDIDKFTYEWLEQSSCPGGGSCDVVDRYPKEKSGYTKQRMWIDTDESRHRQIQYFGKGSLHVKTLNISGYKKFKGRWWRAARLSMQNHQTGKSTILTWKNRKFGISISSRDLSVSGLKRLK